jgi:hypothetical protein
VKTAASTYVDYNIQTHHVFERYKKTSFSARLPKWPTNVPTPPFDSLLYVPARLSDDDPDLYISKRTNRCPAQSTGTFEKQCFGALILLNLCGRGLDEKSGYSAASLPVVIGLWHPDSTGTDVTIQGAARRGISNRAISHRNYSDLLLPRRQDGFCLVPKARTAITETLKKNEGLERDLLGRYLTGKSRPGAGIEREMER